MTIESGNAVKYRSFKDVYRVPVSTDHPVEMTEEEFGSHVRAWGVRQSSRLNNRKDFLMAKKNGVNI